LEELQEHCLVQDEGELSKTVQETEGEIQKMKVEVAKQQLHEAEDRLLLSFHKEKDA
jgi:hypothetical protein